MEQIGVWLSANGRAIYATRPLYPYCHGNVRFTQSKDGKHRYAICLIDESATQASFTMPFKVKKARLVAPVKKSRVRCQQTPDGSTAITVALPTPQQHAIAIEF